MKISNSNAIIMTCLGFFTLLLAYYMVGGTKVDLSIPFVYEGDGLFTLQLAKRTIDGLWIFQSDFLGFPFGADFYDYPGSDFANFLVLKILGLMTGSAAYAVNLFYLFGFPLCSVFTYYVLQKMSVSRFYSIIGALVYTLLPFHFLRIGHLFFTWYFIIPIFFLECFRLMSENSKFNFLMAIKFFCLSLFGVYYAFFGSLCLLASGLAGNFKNKSTRNFKSAVLGVAFIGFGVLLNIAPTVYYHATHGKNPEVGKRYSSESENYGLKIVQLILPRPGHRNSALAKVSAGYISNHQFVNENVTAALGYIGTFGFLWLIFSQVFIAFRKRDDERLHQLAFLTLVMVLVATIGGFSSWFALAISPSIRGWNRISVFIAFTSILTSIILAERLKIKRIYSILFGICLLLFAYWDQATEPCQNCDGNKITYESDHHFVKDIEALVPNGAAIFQLPYMQFPEVTPLFELQDYALSRGYLHSSHLKWSYGGIKGREGDNYYKNLSKLPMNQQVEMTKARGFKGIYIDRRGYGDRGQLVEAELAKILNHQSNLISDDKNLVFFKYD